jgi:pimeloyl-ACP methyl ester carboxylesterase
MIVDRAHDSALKAPTQFHMTGDRELAFRSVGSGTPLILCNRFRGVLDTWDPAFLNALASQGFRVVTFDYSGLGRSSGARTYDPVALAHDAKDLAEGLGLDRFALGGWSLGGIAAQVFLAMFDDRVSHLILMGTTPPGTLVKTAEPLFFEAASTPGYDLPQFTTVFFEPADASSRQASERSFARIFARTEDTSPPVPADWAIEQLRRSPSNPAFPSDEVLRYLEHTEVPILHIAGDHDIVFPVENWYALNRRMPTLHLITYPRSGHGPQHQYPVLSAEQIGSFVRATNSNGAGHNH